MPDKSDDYINDLKMRLLKGFHGLTDKEILEIILSYEEKPSGERRIAAEKLIDIFGGFQEIADADIKKLEDTELMDEQTVFFLKMLPQIAKRYSHAVALMNKACKILNFTDYFYKMYIGESVERAAAACINAEHEIIASRFFERGTGNSAEINLRNIVHFALQSNCSSVVIAHNHPNGPPYPSKKDISATVHISNSLKSVGIILLDHIIVADNKGISMRMGYSFIFS